MYVDESVATQLRDSVPQHLARYRNETFDDLAQAQSWSNSTRFKLKPELLSGLETVADSAHDADAALTVWAALPEITPSLAREGRIWTRLCHVECLPYARKRWISKKSDEAVTKEIRAHFFANSWTAIRDDNAIGRLWWGAYVAYRAMPEDHENAVRTLFRRTDTRSNVMERPWLGSRPPIARTVLKAAMDIPNVTASETNFREFMKALNRSGSGALFELMTDEELNRFATACTPASVLQRTRNKVAKRGKKRKQRKHK